MGQIVGHTVDLELTLDGGARSTGAVTLGVTALDHEALVNAVEGQTVVELFANQLLEILHGDGGDVGTETDDDVAVILHGDLDVLGLLVGLFEVLHLHGVDLGLNGGHVHLHGTILQSEDQHQSHDDQRDGGGKDDDGILLRVLFGGGRFLRLAGGIDALVAVTFATHVLIPFTGRQVSPHAVFSFLQIYCIIKSPICQYLFGLFGLYQIIAPRIGIL